jgi:peptide subunit release factor 1 (eRF1)
MIEVVCPECGVENMYREEDLSLYARVHCEACGAVLEVIEEDPPVLEVAEDLLLDDEDDDEDDYDDESDL